MDECKCDNLEDDRVACKKYPELDESFINDFCLKNENDQRCPGGSIYCDNSTHFRNSSCLCTTGNETVCDKVLPFNQKAAVVLMERKRMHLLKMNDVQEDPYIVKITLHLLTV